MNFWYKKKIKDKEVQSEKEDTEKEEVNQDEEIKKKNYHFISTNDAKHFLNSLKK